MMASDFLQRIKDLPQQKLVLLASQLQERLEQAETNRSPQPIAIVGIGCRFPGGVTDAESYWELLAEGRDAISEVPSDRWDADAFYDEDWRTPGRMATKWGGFLDEVDQFDARLFGISPREAVSMDPQQRMLLEVTWQALERAAIAPGSLAGTRTGVFVGLSSTDYFQVQMRRGSSTIDGYLASGSAPSVAAGRIAYTLGLRGPALAIDTACSSSLVAVHLAVQALRSGECDAAIGAGVNLILSPTTTIALSKSQMMAADGRCKAFSAAADGFVRGEGCGVVVLKRLADARRDGDPIVGVIRGSAINQDGRSNGLTAPNGPAQEAVLSAALADAGLRPADVGYVEAHGTGTRLGDPIEIQALGAVLGRGRPADSRLHVGSVKTLFGHLESAAGIAGLIKAVLVLDKGVIPPHQHLDELSPVIPWSTLPIDIPTAMTPWPADRPRVAGVSSFGFSGTNAHVLLEGPPVDQRTASPPRGANVLALSAQSADALDELIRRHGEGLVTQPHPLDDVCFTLNTGRDTFAHRAAFVVDDLDELTRELLAPGRGESPRRAIRTHVQSTRAVRPVWLFTGQGSQYVGMGRALYESEPTFAEVLDACDTVLHKQFDVPLLDVIWTPGDPRIHQTAFTQPALFSLQAALAALWRSWGVEPSAVLGHSVGEFAAAHVAGLFSLEDGLALIATRGKLMQSLPSGGRMVSVLASPAELDSALAQAGGHVSIAAINGPASTVISGAGSYVQSVLDALGERFQTRELTVSHAFHSPVMDAILDDFAEAAATVTFREPHVPIVSNVFGEPAELDRLGRAEYWRRHVREPVQFGASMAGLVAQGHRVFLEIGPSPTLVGLAARAFDDATIQWVHSLRENKADDREMAQAAAKLWANGTDIDWRGFDGTRTSRRTVLATYPMQRERFWVAGVGPWTVDGSTPATPVDINGLLYGISWPERAHPMVRDATPATFLRSVTDIAGILDAVAPSIAEAHGTARYDDFLPELDGLCGAYVLEGMRELGLALGIGDHMTLETVMVTSRIMAQHRRLVRRLLDMLTEDGWLQAEPDGWRVVRTGTEQPARRYAELLARFPAFEAEIQIIERCGSQVAGILRGDIDALQVLFPGGSSAQMEAIYRDLPLARAFNELVGAAVAAAVEHAPAGRAIRVLEVGAGSGATTDAVLAALRDRTIDYLFTDISPAFTIKARERFRENSAVRFATFDAATDPMTQGQHPGSFDLIVAANVVHATPRLSTTLTNLRTLLAPGGQLLMLEATTRERFSDLTVGFTPGWWAFDDTDVRPDYALLDGARWQSVLGDAGFAASVSAPAASTVASLRREAVVIASAPVAPVDDAPAVGRDPRSWLLVGRGPLSDAVNARLLASGDAVSRVHDGDRSTVAETVRSTGPSGVVVIVEPIDEDAQSAATAASRHDHRRRVETLLGTVHGMLDAPGARPLWIVTRGAQDVDGAIDDARSAVAWGFGHVVEIEHPELTCRRIDVGNSVDSATIEHLVDELQCPDVDEPQLALRGDRRSVRRAVRLVPAPGRAVNLASTASYVVSGGLRGIGLLVGGWLVDHGARHIVLFGRHDPDASALAAIDRWRAEGAVVVVERADAAVDDDVRRVLDVARALAPIRGVIHNAGTLADASLLRQDWAHFETVFGPKVFGTDSIVHELAGDELDFLVLFGSGAGVAGSAGQANHAAANAYLDARAAQLRQQGVPAAAIDWGAWTSVGAAVDHGIDATPGAFSPEQGLAVLGHVIDATIRRVGPAQFVVRSSDWRDVLDRYPAGGEPSLFRDLAASLRSAAGPRPAAHSLASVSGLRESLRALPARRRRIVLRDEVRQLAARVLDIEAVDRIELDEPLHDLGLDSLMAVELRNLLGHALTCELPATLLFEHPSVNALVDHLLGEHLGDVGASEMDSASAPNEVKNASAASEASTGSTASTASTATTDELAARLAERLDRLSSGDRS
jgi:acyl transferase domain-containing protein/SAM-dependent methyltransferase